MEYILGVLASLGAEYLKKRIGTDTLGTYLVVLLASFVLAAVYVFVKDTSIWPVLMQVILTAGAFYAFVIRRF